MLQFIHFLYVSCRERWLALPWLTDLDGLANGCNHCNLAFQPRTIFCLKVYRNCKA